ncbi:MAG TPA: Rne/Rng family ribonuclease, partial [Pyrinomonadaceae bacterium]|nr:Rne/Rng family ribonuclease [Pyrinomonadaceae bacterium]
QRIEAEQERAEPLQAEAPPRAVEQSESTDAGRRRGRRGRRRGRWERGEEEPTTTAPAQEEPEEFDVPDTPFVSGDPSIERIVDEEEAATANGEMFKDARLQERIFDQIHAVEFNMEDDFRTAEVGSLLSSGFGGDTFERVADDDVEGEPIRAERRPPEAHVSSFVDDVSDDTLRRMEFQRISDDEEEALPAVETTTTASKRSRKSASPASKKRPAKAATKTASKKRAASKKSSKKKAAAASDAESASGETYSDSEAAVMESQSRGEFATRRGGRRRRRASKNKPGSSSPAEVEAVSGDGLDDDNDQPQILEVVEEVEAPLPPAAPPQAQSDSHPRPPRGREQRDQRDKRDQRPHRGQRRERHQPAITDLLSEGQEILVQIAKEPIAKKGARITSHIALPGRFLVYMPTVEHVGVSRKIESDNERHRLRKLIQTLRAEEDVPSGGFIVRTAGVGISEKELREDVRYLVRTWLDIRASAEKSKAPALVHKDLDLVQRLLRDQLSDDFESIRVDSEEEYQAIVEFVNRIQPRLVRRVKLYTKDQPILEAYGVATEIDKAIKPRVWLKSGGYLVINQTEALVAIDVNTGKFVGRGSGRLEDTITRTNLEAVDEIVRQIRLRDLGGIIVLDLIDMEERRNRQKVMQALQDALRNDKSPTKVLSFNDFGLVIMTRKRVKQSLERTLCSPCPYCTGAGLVKSPQTICYELLEGARQLAKDLNGDGKNKQVTLRINPDVAKALRTSERDVMIEIEDYLGPIDITSDPTIHQEQFDFAVI